MSYAALASAVAQRMSVSGGVHQPIPCQRCGKTIAEWDAARGAIIIRRPPSAPYLEFPTTDAVIQCHREVSSHGRFVVCGHVNRVHIET